ncbi:hypothetical protein NDU88_002112 [Pleurodeles waltl]|uniref:Uncharacterized protein n=1 Tax=Pleurodeles waltl TaxID=8319 RepID=A0AAV7UC78_PLEWA|nr:hypothetical protein NDU88_002112 [Pleurodeles waltl]
MDAPVTRQFLENLFTTLRDDIAAQKPEIAADVKDIRHGRSVNLSAMRHMLKELPALCLDRMTAACARLIQSIEINNYGATWWPCNREAFLPRPLWIPRPQSVPRLRLRLSSFGSGDL